MKHSKSTQRRGKYNFLPSFMTQRRIKGMCNVMTPPFPNPEFSIHIHTASRFKFWQPTIEIGVMNEETGEAFVIEPDDFKKIIVARTSEWSVVKAILNGEDISKFTNTDGLGGYI